MLFFYSPANIIYHPLLYVVVVKSDVWRGHLFFMTLQVRLNHQNVRQTTAFTCIVFTGFILLYKKQNA